MAQLHGKNVGIPLLEALGIDWKNVNEVTVRIAVGDIVEATVKRFPEGHEVDAFTRKLKELTEHYKMVPIEDTD